MRNENPIICTRQIIRGFTALPGSSRRRRTDLPAVQRGQRQRFIRKGVTLRNASSSKTATIRAEPPRESALRGRADEPYDPIGPRPLRRSIPRNSSPIP